MHVVTSLMCIKSNISLIFLQVLPFQNVDALTFLFLLNGSIADAVYEYSYRSLSHAGIGIHV